MKHTSTYRRVARIVVSLLTVLSLLLPVSSLGPAFAVGPDQPVGPQGPVGPQKPVGPQLPVGPQGPVGPQAESEIQIQSASGTTALSPVVAESNSTTGTDSTNTNQVASSSTTEVEQTNGATINNKADLTLNTGENTIGKNTVTEDISTGSINGSVNIINIANSELAPESTVGSQVIDGSQSSQLVLDPINQRTSLANDTTGPDSNNSNTVSSNNVIKVIDQNNADTQNDLTIEANTGKNDVSNSTKIGDITTGNINLSANLINLLNVLTPNLTLTLDIWSVLGNFNGDIILNNGATGPESNNQNSTASTGSMTVSNTNNSAIDNVFDFQTNTGGNTVDSGTAMGSITTGEAKTQSSTTNVANLDAPVLYLINVFGEWSGALDGVDPNSVIVNTVTGPGSNNINTTENNQSTDINVENNASASNLVTIKANTGDNHIGKNTVTGNLKTGSINIAASAVNILNSFGDNAKNLVLKVINIFGNWNGNVSNQPKPSDNGSDNQNTGGDTSTDSQNEAAVPSTAATTTQSNASGGESTGTIQSTATVESTTDAATSNSVSISQNGQRTSSASTNKILGSTRSIVQSVRPALSDVIENDIAPTQDTGNMIDDFSGTVLAATDDELPTGGAQAPLTYIALSALGVTLLWGLIELLARYYRLR